MVSKKWKLDYSTIWYLWSVTLNGLSQIQWNFQHSGNTYKSLMQYMKSENIENCWMNGPVVFLFSVA